MFFLFIIKNFMFLMLTIIVESEIILSRGDVCCPRCQVNVYSLVSIKSKIIVFGISIINGNFKPACNQHRARFTKKKSRKTLLGSQL